MSSTNLQKLVDWIESSGILAKTDKITITVTKTDVSVEYDPPIVSAAGQA